MENGSDGEWTYAYGLHAKPCMLRTIILLIIVMVYLIREKLILSYETAKQTKEWHMMTMSLQKLVHGNNNIVDACKPLFFTWPNSHYDNNYDHRIML